MLHSITPHKSGYLIACDGENNCGAICEKYETCRISFLAGNNYIHDEQAQQVEIIKKVEENSCVQLPRVKRDY